MAPRIKQDLVRKSSAITAQQSQDWLIQMPQLADDETKMLELMRQAYNAYLSTDASLRDVAVKFNIPIAVLHDWDKMGKWSDRRMAFRNELLLDAERSYLAFVKDNRTATAQEIVTEVRPLISKMALHMSAMMDSGDDPLAKYEIDTVGLRRMAEALKYVSDIVSKAVGLDSPLPQMAKTETEKTEATSGKMPFLNMNVRGPVTIDSGSAGGNENGSN